METEIRNMLHERAAAFDPAAAWPPALARRTRQRRVRNSIVALATTTAVIVGAVAGVNSLRGSEVEFTSPPIRPKAKTTISGGAGAEIVAGFGSVWVEQQDAVARIDPATNKVIARIVAAEAPRPATGGGFERDRFYFGVGGLAAGEGSVWVTGTGPFPEPVTSSGAPAPETVRPPEPPPPDGSNTSYAWSLFRIDPRTNSITRAVTVDTGLLPGAIAVGHGAVWVAAGGFGAPPGGGGGALYRIDPETGRVSVIALDGPVAGFAVIDDFLWAAADVNRAGARGVVKIDPRTNRTVQTVLIPGAIALQGLVHTDGTLWVPTIRETGPVSVVSIDTRRAEIMDVIPVRAPVPAIAAGGGYVWVTGQDERHVTRIDPTFGEITGRLPAGGVVGGLLADGSSLWVMADPDGDGGPKQSTLIRYEL